MELRKVNAPSNDSDHKFCRQTELIRDKLGSALRIVDQIAGLATPLQQNQPVDEKTIRTLIKLRRSRDRFFGAELFADPAWDILLELYLSNLSQQRMSVSSLCVGAAVPSTTALRWITHLERSGFITRRSDPTDGRRFFVSLTSDGLKRMEDYFRTVPNGSPLI